MLKSDEYEASDEYKTGNICSESGHYFCDMHPSIEIYLNKGDTFPKCNQKNIPHNTKWDKIVARGVITY